MSLAGRVLVVVPTYNERDNVTPLVRELLAQGAQIDVTVADDGSPDGTGAAVHALASEHGPRVTLLDLGRKNGRGAAVIAAFRQGLNSPRDYQVFVEMDADFSHAPSDLPRLLALLQTVDMAIGSRYVEGGSSSEWGVARPLLSWAANRYVALVAGLPIRDATSGYRAYRRAVVEAIDFGKIRIRGYAVHGETAYQAWIAGFQLGEIPIHFKNRARQASKLTTREVVMAFLNFALLRFRYGFRPRARTRPGQ